MTDKKRQLPDKIVDADGRPTLDFIAWADDLIYGAGADSIGTLLSGQNTTSSQVTGIINGTQPVTDVLISGRGTVTDALDATNGTVGDVSVASGVLTVVAAPTYASGREAGGGAITTGSIEFTVSNGTGPYTATFTKVSGDTFTANNTTFSGNTLITTFSTTMPSGWLYSAQYKLTVTDTSDSSTCTVTVWISAYDTTGIYDTTEISA